MKTIAVIGAAGQTGIEVVKLALANGFAVRGLDLRRGNLPDNPRFTFIQGSALDPNDVTKTIQGCDVVVSELGTPFGSRSTLVSEGNRTIVECMTQLGMKRLITQSAFGALESRSKLPFYLRIIANSPLMNAMYVDKDRMEEIVTQSKLEWTIVRPIVLTNQAPKHHFRAAEDLTFDFTAHIGRADVAEFILIEIEQRQFIGRKVTVTY